MLRIWGFNLEYDGQQFNACDDTETIFNVTAYEQDANGLPAEEIHSTSLIPSQQKTDTSYGPGYPLIQFDIPMETNGDIRWISIDTQEINSCWFFWMGTNAGEGVHFALDNETNVFIQVNQGLSYCINP